jgi:hypothetical protein
VQVGYLLQLQAGCLRILYQQLMMQQVRTADKTLIVLKFCS